jgi:hypothetical protein
MRQQLIEEVAKYLKTLVRYEVNAMLADKQYTQHVTTKVNKAGHIWSHQEDRTLEKEITAAIQTIACNHGRTENAICCRIRDKNLIWREK